MKDYDIADRTIELRRVLPRRSMLESMLQRTTDHRSREAIRSEIRALNIWVAAILRSAQDRPADAGA